MAFVSNTGLASHCNYIALETGTLGTGRSPDGTKLVNASRLTASRWAALKPRKELTTHIDRIVYTHSATRWRMLESDEASSKMREQSLRRSL